LQQAALFFGSSSLSISALIVILFEFFGELDEAVVTEEMVDCCSDIRTGTFTLAMCLKARLTSIPSLAEVS
jgi:hypothetical protein